MQLTTNLGAFVRCAALLGAALLASPPAQSEGLIPGYPDTAQTSYDPREIALLPDYCKYLQLFRDNVPGANDPVARERWYATLGPTWQHLHHYCWAQMNMNRAKFLAPTEQARKFFRREAIAEMNYVILRAPRDFVLLPEILSRKGECQILVGDGGAAMATLERALLIKPDYWPPYAQMSDYYKDLGDRTKAREFLERGLSNAPDAPALKRRLAELGETKTIRPKTSNTESRK